MNKTKSSQCIHGNTVKKKVRFKEFTEEKKQSDDTYLLAVSSENFSDVEQEICHLNYVSTQENIRNASGYENRPGKNPDEYILFPKLEVNSEMFSCDSLNADNNLIQTGLYPSHLKIKEAKSLGKNEEDEEFKECCFLLHDRIKLIKTAPLPIATILPQIQVNDESLDHKNVQSTRGHLMPVKFLVTFRAIPSKKLVEGVSGLLTHILGLNGPENFTILRVGGPEIFAILCVGGIVRPPRMIVYMGGNSVGGWSEKFCNIGGGWDENNCDSGGGWSTTSSADTPPLTFNGIAPKVMADFRS